VKRRTRHLLILTGVPLLMTLAIGGWLVDAVRKPFAHLRRSSGPQRLQPTSTTSTWQ
jgi:hypothetical protein